MDVKKKLVLLYISEDDKQVPVSTWFMDFAKITELVPTDLKNTTIVVLYSAVKSYGSYNITINSEENGGIEIERLVEHPDLSDVNTLISFIETNMKLYPDRYTLLTYAGHCTKYFLIPHGKKYIAINQLGEKMREKKIVLDIFVLDCCYASNLEIVYEMKDIVKYIIANQYYSPDLGFISKTMMSSFDKVENEKDLYITCKNIVKSFIKKNEYKFHSSKEEKYLKKSGKIKDISAKLHIHPVDAVVIDCKYITPFVDYFTDEILPYLDKSDIKNISKLEKRNNWYFNYDLYDIIEHSRHINRRDKKNFEKIFNLLVPYYKQNTQIEDIGGEHFHGISIYPRLIPGFKRSYRQLSIVKEKDCCLIDKKSGKNKKRNRNR